MPSLHDELMGPAAEELIAAHGETGEKGDPQSAIVWIDAAGREHLTAGVVHELKHEPADANEWASAAHAEAQQEMVDVTCFDTTLMVTDRWRVRIPSRGPGEFRVERVRRSGHAFTATLAAAGATRIQREGLE